MIDFPDKSYSYKDQNGKILPKSSKLIPHGGKKRKGKSGKISFSLWKGECKECEDQRSRFYHSFRFI
jgi:hypothetical protein